MLPWIALAAAFLTGCAAGTSDPVCPTLTPYSAEEQRQAAEELAQLPPGGVIERMIGDYAAVREEIRACRA